MSEGLAGVSITCAGCGARVDPRKSPLVFACPRRAPGDDIDHVLAYGAAPGDAAELAAGAFADNEENPFVRYRFLQHSWRLWQAHGMADDEYVALVRDMDARVQAVDGRGFVITPYVRSHALGVWIKDETGNVSGSHKARHLMGIAIYLAVVDRLGLVSAKERGLAIASCGNAALAAAVVARAVERPLTVFIPPWADASVVARLRDLGAELVVCERAPGGPPGDPCYHRFREAVAAGLLPFTCQGSENGLTIDGGMTLGFELATQHGAFGAAPLDHLFIQVGGGALASSVVQALALAVDLGVLSRMLRIWAVQTAGAHPLERAWERVRQATYPDPVDHARSHRSEYMWPWESEPKSIASGILDDETYDWLAIVKALRDTGGSVVLAREATLAEARDTARAATGIDASATGTAGLAGVFEVRASGAAAAAIAPDEQIAVLFTGARR